MQDLYKPNLSGFCVICQTKQEIIIFPFLPDPSLKIHLLIKTVITSDVSYCSNGNCYAGQ